MKRRGNGKKAQTHTELVRNIIEFLDNTKAWADKYHTGVWRGATGRPVRSCPTGHPDIMARVKPGKRGDHGRVVWIEAKVGKDTLSAAQLEWKRKALMHGDIFIEARSVDDVIKTWGAK